MTKYDREPDMPGAFTYSSSDCRDHGPNVPFAAARGGSGPKLCVACMLVELQRCAAPEVRKPLQHVPLSNEDVRSRAQVVLTELKLSPSAAKALNARVKSLKK